LSVYPIRQKENIEYFSFHIENFKIFLLKFYSFIVVFSILMVILMNPGY